MAELLLELLSEEIPARMQARGAADLKRLVTEGLKAARLDFESAQAFATPRRLALVVGGLPLRQPDLKEERRGPRVDAPAKAIQGFLNTAGFTSVDQCYKRETEKGTFLFAVIEKKGKPAEDVLPPIIVTAINDLRWPKSMRWANTIFSWIRPLHGILAILDSKQLQQSYSLGIRRGSSGNTTQEHSIAIDFGNKTRGHRFLSPEPFEVTGFAEYEVALRAAYVILDPAERRDIIEKQADRLAGEAGLSVRPDPALLDEVTGLVEWPAVLMGRIDAAFMQVPPEVLTMAMRAHQKYFALKDKNGDLAPRFVFVANTVIDDNNRATITAGNERVLRARLADAKFFWDQDRKTKLEARIPALDAIVFHAKLGSLRDKVRRMEKLAEEIAADWETSKPEWTEVGDAAAEKVAIRAGEVVTNAKRAARLAKADLTTEMVGEFPDLQGTMGRYYALNDGEHEDVARAVAEHYAPVGPNDVCPTAPISVAVALADKIDTLFWFFAIGQPPTGSKDPFALRRAALGAIRLIVENELRIPLASLFDVARQLGPGELGRFSGPQRSRRTQEIIDSLVEFFADRLKVHLRERGVRHDLIAAVFALSHEDDLIRLLARVEALGTFLDSDDGEHLLTAYRRAANIVRIEEKRDGVRYTGTDIDQSLLIEADEIAVADRLSEILGFADAAIDRDDFSAAMGALAQLRAPIDAFFDNVTVNCDDADLRANRLCLLSEIQTTMNKIADFSKIEG